MKKLQNGNYELTERELREYVERDTTLTLLEYAGINKTEAYEEAEWDNLETWIEEAMNNTTKGDNNEETDRKEDQGTQRRVERQGQSIGGEVWETDSGT